ncbi:MAG: amidohydrolase [Clostridia bacterium]|nr:amidohydrolase [Clostridia bacterium]
MKTLYYNGCVFGSRQEMHQAFGVEDGIFTHAGDDAALLALSWDEKVDLQGAFVCPGFNDSHMHLLNLGNTMGMCPLGDVHSLSEMLERLSAFMEKRQKDGHPWLQGRGWNQDLFTPATGMPTRAALDRVSRDVPICIVRCCGHALCVNSRALEVLGLDEDTPCPMGGTIGKDENGRLNGLFMDAAMPLVQGRLPAPTVEDMKKMLLAAMERLNSVGITSCQTDDLLCFENVPWQDVLRAYQELEAEGKMTVRVCEQSQFTTTEGLQAFFDAGYKTGTGNAWFKIGPLKMLGDGSLGARTAFLENGYADAPHEKGLALFTQQQFDEMISMAHKNGMQCAVHVIGDGVLEMVLRAYEKAFRLSPRQDHRSGLIHVQLTRQEQLEKIRELGLCVHVQTIFIDYDSHIVYQRAGEKLANTSYAFLTMQRMGIPLSNGTDCPVEDPNPFRGIQCAVTRQPLDSSLPPYRQEEGMTVSQALHTYTAAGAYDSFEEHFKGKIAPGMAADFAVLSENPLETAPEKLQHIQVQSTFLQGKKVFQRA